MPDYKITYSDELVAAPKELIFKGLKNNALAKRNIGAENNSFSFLITGNDGSFIGGVQGYNYYGCFYIDLLYVDNKHRSKGYGGMLMKKCEELARERNCLFMSLSTMDFEARPFYEQHGFELEFTRTGFEKNSVMYCMRKSL